MNLDTVEAVRQLDEGLRKIDGIGPLHVNLEKAWKACMRHPSGEHLFPSVLDMQLHVARLNIEINSIAKRVNADLRESMEVNCLADDGGLTERLDLFGDATAFVFRYRALWDKIMGVVILLLDPKRYQKFVKAKSRKKEFVKLLKARGGRWTSYAQVVDETIEAFDSRFRTAEAHGSGKLRNLPLIGCPLSLTLLRTYSGLATVSTISCLCFKKFLIDWAVLLGALLISWLNQVFWENHGNVFFKHINQCGGMLRGNQGWR